MACAAYMPFYLRCFALFLLLIPVLVAQEQNGPAKTQLSLRDHLQTALKDVDRLTVTPPVEDWGRLEPHKTTLFELRDAKRIATLANTVVIEIEEGWSVPCLCYGTHEIMFFSGEKVKFRMNYKHFSRVRFVGTDIPYAGEYDLTKESAAAFANWFEENGFADFKKTIAEQEATLRAEQERARRVAAMFPEDVRAVIPEYDDSNEDWTRLDTRKKLAADAMVRAKNRNEILYACWDAIGREYDNIYKNADEIEPVATLFALIAAASDSDKNTALMDISPDKTEILYGACVALCSQEKSMGNLSDSILAKVFSSVWLHQTEKRWILPPALKKANGSECMNLRMKIVRSGQPSPTPYEPPITLENDKDGNRIMVSIPALSPWIEVLLDLSLQRAPEAQKIILEKLKIAPEGLDKLTLEVALACYDGTGKLRERHFNIEQPDIVHALDILAPNRRKTAK